VNAASLPYTVLLLLIEMAVGGLAVMTVFDARRAVTPGYVKAGALTVFPLAVLALWTWTSLGRADMLDGYAIAAVWYRPAGAGLAVFAVVSAAHALAALAERHGFAVRLGVAGSAAGVVSLGLLAALLAPPAWSYAGLLLSLLASAMVLGTGLMSMLWGHWYLTSGRLPKEPMEQMALLLVGALAVQVILVLLGALLPAREAPLSEAALGLSLGRNPAFWLRVGVGLVFPVGVAYLAWRAAAIRGMMSATGLLYIALGAILAGEVLARGLLFSTGAAV
jgi:hypothetical protein